MENLCQKSHVTSKIETIQLDHSHFSHFFLLAWHPKGQKMVCVSDNDKILWFTTHNDSLYTTNRYWVCPACPILLIRSLLYGIKRFSSSKDPFRNSFHRNAALQLKSLVSCPMWSRSWPDGNCGLAKECILLSLNLFSRDFHFPQLGTRMNPGCSKEFQFPHFLFNAIISLWSYLCF